MGRIQSPTKNPLTTKKIWKQKLRISRFSDFGSQNLRFGAVFTFWVEWRRDWRGMMGSKQNEENPSSRFSSHIHHATSCRFWERSEQSTGRQISPKLSKWTKSKILENPRIWKIKILKSGKSRFSNLEIQDFENKNLEILIFDQIWVAWNGTKSKLY